MEHEIVDEIEKLVVSGNFGRPVMPAYDGLLVELAGAEEGLCFAEETFMSQWKVRSEAKFDFFFPLKVEKRWLELEKKDKLAMKAFEEGSWKTYDIESWSPSGPGS